MFARTVERLFGIVWGVGCGFMFAGKRNGRDDGDSVMAVLHSTSTGCA